MEKTSVKTTNKRWCGNNVHLFQLLISLVQVKGFSDVERIFRGMVGMDGICFSESFNMLVNVITNYAYSITYREHDFIIPLQSAVYILVFGFIALRCGNSIEIANALKAFKYKHVLFVGCTLMYIVLANTQTVPAKFLYFNF